MATVLLGSALAVALLATPARPAAPARPQPCLGVQVQPAPGSGGLGGQIGSITHAGDGSRRLFLAMLDGRILIYTGAAVLPTPFLNIDPLVRTLNERGLLGLAFHPAYRRNGLFFVYYTREPEGDIVLARYQVSTADPNQADPASGVTMLVIPHATFENHNGGQLAFGPDGYLYIAVGDGGAGGDQYEAGQRLDTCGGVNGTPLVPCFLAKLLRIDVNQSMGTPPYYGIPPDNPFQSGGPQTCGPAFPGSTCDEIWAYGLRNAWRFSFDRLTGDLFIADVGQQQREEVNLQPAGSPGGRNYGWDVLEGTHCFEDVPPGSCGTFLGGGSTLPILEYDHSAGDCSITGGYRYRGSAYPALQGVYVYADYCSRRIWGAVPTGQVVKGRPAWTAALLGVATGTGNLHTFGEDEGGELYVGHGGFTLQRLVVTDSCN